MKLEVVKILKDAFNEEEMEVSKEEIGKFVEIPKEYSNGDFAFPCFFLAKKLKENPHDIAIQIRTNIGSEHPGFSSVEVEGAYINFFIDRKKLAFDLIEKIKVEGQKFGKTNIGKKEKTMIEFPSPNTNKPLHLGHLRNMTIGESISRISEFNGEKIIRANLNNDKGVHICKSMLAYDRWGKGKKPTKKIKSDHLVGEYYVMYSKKQKKKPELENEAHAMLGLWEKKDKATVELWKKMSKWALDGFKETYSSFGIKHNKEYFESKIYTKGKEIILDGAKKGIFEKLDDGSIKFNLKKEGLGEKYLLRADGTSLYITQDIYLAYLKQKEFDLTKSYYVVGNEQEYHFKVLFEILKRLKIPLTELKHISYGMVNLPDGKMKSREGTVVDADNLIDKIQSLVKKEILKRDKILKKELDRRSHLIALASIKYMLLKIDIKKNMLFDPKAAISFEGNTGPYLQYSYARASSILRKAKKSEEQEFEKLDEKEIELILKMNEFPIICSEAYTQLNPSLIANYAYKLAQIFNEFYHACPVIGDEKENFRIELIKSFRQVLKNSLYLLGIETLEEM